jgi:phosphonate transport system ATP-binding protein
MSETPILAVENLSKSFRGRRVLSSLNFNINPGQVVVLLGSSGAGKTTLFKIISGLLASDEGKLIFAGRSLVDLKGRERRLARREIGFIFQQFNLIRRMDALSNVLGGRLGYASTMRVILRRFSAEDQVIAKNCLAEVGLAQQIWQRADSLSGGQQQRVAIARALAQQCRFILADEPVASLDPESSHSVLRTLKQVAKDHGVGVLCSLHQVDLATTYADHIIGLAGGKVVCKIPASDMTSDIMDRIYGKPSASPVQNDHKEIKDSPERGFVGIDGPKEAFA